MQPHPSIQWGFFPNLPSSVGCSDHKSQLGVITSSPHLSSRLDLMELNYRGHKYERKEFSEDEENFRVLLNV